MILWSPILRGSGKKLEGLNKFIGILFHFSSDIVPNTPHTKIQPRRVIFLYA